MASHNRCSSTPGLPHISALNVVLEMQHMKSITHRLFYIAKISPERNDYSEITDHYEMLFHKLQKFNLGESISGLLLIYHTCVIHIIESTSEILYEVIQDLVHIENIFLREARILVVSHSISSRLFQQWYFRIIKLPVHYFDDSMEGQSEEEVVEECLTKLMKLGTFLSKMPHPGSKGPGEDLLGLAPELLVQEEAIHFLMKFDSFLKPEEFLAMYDRPMNASSVAESQSVDLVYLRDAIFGSLPIWKGSFTINNGQSLNTSTYSGQVCPSSSILTSAAFTAKLAGFNLKIVLD
ncbi:PREDICTED: uncharacterized protein C7orf62-like [Nanorana parkeri]|uniref:uncharacterized protein C7orf62-like n=1 Tax=Nanorana parkeri TaxID=125878 RepID=UPI0008545A34|nr:PREDICTED: uncharacterized protein C7orf62-like [Nanorana parkeri]